MGAADLQLELVSNLTAAADSMRKTAEFMLQSAKVATQLADTLKESGASTGKHKVGSADDDDEPLTANGKRKRVTKKKDPNAPKRPASSYLMFQNAVRKEIKEKFPNLNNTELLNVIKTQWNEMPAAKKQKYNDQRDKDKERYEAEKSAYGARSPEEVARADAKVAADAALKQKAKGKRKPKAEKVAAPSAPAAPVTDEEAPRTSEGEEADEVEDDDEEDDDEPASVPAPPTARPRPAPTDSSEDEEEDDSDDDSDDDEEEEEPAPKKAKVTSSKPVSKSAPAPPVKDKKKKSAKA